MSTWTASPAASSTLPCASEPTSIASSLVVPSPYSVDADMVVSPPTLPAPNSTLYVTFCSMDAPTFQCDSTARVLVLLTWTSYAAFAEPFDRLLCALPEPTIAGSEVARTTWLPTAAAVTRHGPHPYLANVPASFPASWSSSLRCQWSGFCPCTLRMRRSRSDSPFSRSESWSRRTTSTVAPDTVICGVSPRPTASTCTDSDMFRSPFAAVRACRTESGWVDRAPPTTTRRRRGTSERPRSCPPCTDGERSWRTTRVAPPPAGRSWTNTVGAAPGKCQPGACVIVSCC